MITNLIHSKVTHQSNGDGGLIAAPARLTWDKGSGVDPRNLSCCDTAILISLSPCLCGARGVPSWSGIAAQIVILTGLAKPQDMHTQLVDTRMLCSRGRTQKTKHCYFSSQHSRQGRVQTRLTLSIQTMRPGRSAIQGHCGLRLLLKNILCGVKCSTLLAVWSSLVGDLLISTNLLLPQQGLKTKQFININRRNTSVII